MRPEFSRWPRSVNIVLGAWVVVSTVLWSASTAASVNGVVLGAMIAAVGLLALFAQQARAVNVILAVWLFASAWFIPGTTSYLFVSHLLTALAVLCVAAMPRGEHLEADQEWPDIPATGDHEPFLVAPPVDRAEERTSGRGTMW